MFVSRQFVNVWRHSTRYFRHLPTTMILGGHRGETRQLYSLLARHPRCFPAAVDDSNYFTLHPARSVGWYRAHFPLSIRVTRKQSHVIDASAACLATPSAVRQMKLALPKIRIVVLLSDPVARAHAHYRHRSALGEEMRGFAECIAHDLRSMSHSGQPGVACQPQAAPTLGYISQGYYALQLELLLKLYPRNKVLLMDSAALLQSPCEACERVFDFMGLENEDVGTATLPFSGRAQELIDPAVAAMLRDHYRPYDELLSEVSGQQYSWMRSRVARAA